MNALKRRIRSAQLDRVLQARAQRVQVRRRDSGHLYFSCDLVVDPDEREGRIGLLGWSGIVLAGFLGVETVWRVVAEIVRSAW